VYTRCKRTAIQTNSRRRKFATTTSKDQENWNRGDFAQAQRHNYNNRSLLITVTSHVLVEWNDVLKNDRRSQVLLHLMNVCPAMHFIVVVIKVFAAVELPITPQQLQLYVDTQAVTIVDELAKS